MNRLFDVGRDGLLREVSQASRAKRRHSAVNMTIDILLTPAEETARDAEEAADAARRQALAEASAASEKRREAARAKLEALGISADDLKDALS